MKRGFQPVVVPLLAVALFVVAPAVAQATPHWYSNGNKMEEGVKVPYVSWGTIKFLENTSGASVECQNVVGGYDENPTGGFAGKSEVNGWTAYNCNNTQCEAAGGKVGVVFENETGENSGANPPRLEWPGEVIEPKAGVFRLENTNVRMFTRCQLGAARGLPNPEVKEEPVTTEVSKRTDTEFYASGSVCTTGGGGSSNPLLVAGIAGEAAKPSKFKFSGGEGGELNCGAAGKGITTGTVKTMGSLEEETLTVKNP